MVDRGEHAAGADRALSLKGRQRSGLIAGILLGNNLVNIFATSLATALLTTLLGEGWWSAIRHPRDDRDGPDLLQRLCPHRLTPINDPDAPRRVSRGPSAS